MRTLETYNYFIYVGNLSFGTSSITEGSCLSGREPLHHLSPFNSIFRFLFHLSHRQPANIFDVVASAFHFLCFLGPSLLARSSQNYRCQGWSFGTALLNSFLLLVLFSMYRQYNSSLHYFFHCHWHDRFKCLLSRLEYCLGSGKYLLPIIGTPTAI